MSEGVPSIKSIDEDEERFFTFTIEDPDVEKLTIQMTTIHGDPDMFMSTLNQTPSIYEYEYRSTNSGIFPEVIELLNTTRNITGTYYIMVKGWEESTFSLVYYTKTKGGIGT